jgi:hypothetical protein
MVEQREPVKSGEAVTSKQRYEAPKAVFVPLKPEERLMACGKLTGVGSTPCAGAFEVVS